jgi:hypothetical protein
MDLLFLRQAEAAEALSGTRIKEVQIHVIRGVG